MATVSQRMAWGSPYHHPDFSPTPSPDDVEIIAGTGTLGIEILEQVADCHAIVVPIGGAGLIAGIALAVKTLK